MRATVYHAPWDVRVETVPDPRIEGPGDAILRITHACICGSDLWFYRGLSTQPVGQCVGHEMLGTVEAVGTEVRSVRVGDTVLVPISFADGTCDYCRRGLHTSCPNGGFMGAGGNSGGQAEGARVPYADATLVRVPDEIAGDDAMLVRALPLTDVMSTGHHAAVAAGVCPGSTTVVVGDGAVGLCAVLAARRLGAQRVVIVGRHTDRLAIAELLGAEATAIREGAGLETVRERLNGGAEHVLECVGSQSSLDAAITLARDGGTIGFVGVPYTVERLDIRALFRRNISLKGGVTPARAYIPELLDAVVAGTLDPSPVLDSVISLEDVPNGYAAMDTRDALKVMIRT